MNAKFSNLGSTRASRVISGTLAGNPPIPSVPLGEAPSEAREGACAPQP